MLPVTELAVVGAVAVPVMMPLVVMLGTLWLLRSTRALMTPHVIMRVARVTLLKTRMLRLTLSLLTDVKRTTLSPSLILGASLIADLVTIARVCVLQDEARLGRLSVLVGLHEWVILQAAGPSKALPECPVTEPCDTMTTVMPQRREMLSLTSIAAAGSSSSSSSSSTIIRGGIISAVVQ
jgi:hypothetical protein